MEEVRIVSRLAGPLVVQNVLGYSLVIVCVIVTGHYCPGPETERALPLAAIVLSNSLYNVTGLSVIIGLASTLETYCGHAHANSGGARSRHLMNGYLARGTLVCLVVAALIAVLWTQTERLLLFVGQKPSLASLSGKYMVWILPSLFASAVEECGKRFLQSQNVVFAPTLVLAAATSAGVATMYCLTALRGWGLLGVATGYNVANVLMALGRTAMVLWVNYGQGSAFGWVAGRALAQQAVSGWYHYLQLGVPAVVQICSEWWVFEIITLLAGLLPKTDVEVASVGVLFQLAAVFYMIPMAVQSAAATRVSNELGALNPGKAARAAWICLSIGRSMTVAFAVLLLATRTRVALIFVKGTPRRLGGHPYVVQRVTEAIPVLAAATLNDGVDGVYNGILRGCGLQGRSAAINLLSNWGVGLPLALLLGFVEGQGIVGFWTGMAVSLLVANITYYIITCRIDWEALARKELHMESDLAAASPLLPRAGESEDPERA